MRKTEMLYATSEIGHDKACEDAETSIAVMFDQSRFKISKKREKQCTVALTGRFNWRL
jgi:hypothetical protein